MYAAAIELAINATQIDQIACTFPTLATSNARLNGKNASSAASFQWKPHSQLNGLLKTTLITMTINSGTHDIFHGGNRRSLRCFCSASTP